MAKITAYVPEPTQEYNVDNQRQILEAVNTIKNQLNFGFQKDIRDELETFNWFLIGTGVRKNIRTKISDVIIVSGQFINSNVGSVTVTTI
jgi:hypothetical protein